MDFTPPQKKSAPSMQHPSGDIADSGSSANVPDRKMSLGEFTEAQRRRAARNSGESSGLDTFLDAVADDRASSEGEPEAKEEKPATKEKPAVDPDNPDGLAWLDPWDKPGAVQRIDPDDPLAQYRVGKGHELAMPESVASFSEADEASLRDFGHIAVREGWSKEFAQSLVDQIAADFRTEKSRPGPEGYIPERTVSELRVEFGPETEAILGRVEAYCARRPALSAYLDSTGLGNSPSVVRLLAAVASDPSIITKEGAKKFIDKLGKNDAYWQGSKLEVAKSRIAFMLADSK
jgi:hypothetical protein